MYVVSIDNVDILQPHSFVSNTDATRSWHGTSVQCIQPLPHTCTVSNEEIKDHPIRARKHPHSSPIASPIPVVKHKRQWRTLKEIPSPHSAVSRTPMLDETDVADYHVPHVTLTLPQFHLNTMEISAIDKLREDMLKSLFLKHAQSRPCLPSIPSLVSVTRHVTRRLRMLYILKY